MRVAIFALVVAGGLALPSHAEQAATGVPVGVVKAERKKIGATLDFVGRVEAINRVEIKARVTGFLEEVLFKEGDPIKEGGPLHRIEKGLFQAAVEQAEGALERSKAAKELSAVNSNAPRNCSTRTPARRWHAISRRQRTTRLRARSRQTRPVSRPPRSISATPISCHRSPERPAKPT
jgi:multidrug efflux pump subunit AcrA (membrane-fusion protein)